MSGTAFSWPKDVKAEREAARRGDGLPPLGERQQHRHRHRRHWQGRVWWWWSHGHCVGPEHGPGARAAVLRRPKPQPSFRTAVDSSPARLVATAPENILPLLKTTVEGRQLVVRLEGCVSLDEPIKISAGEPSLSSLRVSGSGLIDAAGLSGKVLRVKVSGSGRVVAFGQLGTVRVDVSGLGNVDRDVSGSGSAHAYASESARVDVSGAGSVRVAGNAAQRNVDRSGSGQVFFR